MANSECDSLLSLVRSDISNTHHIAHIILLQDLRVLAEVIDTLDRLLHRLGHINSEHALRIQTLIVSLVLEAFKFAVLSTNARQL